MKLSLVAESGSIDKRDELRFLIKRFTVCCLPELPLTPQLLPFLAYNRINNKLFPSLTSIDHETRPFPNVRSYFNSEKLVSFLLLEFRELTRFFKSASEISGKINEGSDCEAPIRKTITRVKKTKRIMDILIGSENGQLQGKKHDLINILFYPFPTYYSGEI